MSITKYISTGFEVGESFGSPTKTANWQPERYVPPEIEEFVHSLEPDPRFSYVHLIAMTDGDWYGQNLNGDIFDEDQLLGLQSQSEALKNQGDLRGVPIPRYQTFQQARFYRKHRNSPNSPFYGDVPCVAWNQPMRRVELIVRIAKEAIPDMGMEKAPDIVIKLDKRGFITVSMGCNITHETCSYCNATNQFIKDRCSHLKNQMGQIMPNGVRVGARNYGMKFFDISDVDIPADDTAFSLQKVAGLCINEAFDTLPELQKAAWVRKWADIKKQISMQQGCLGEITPKPAKTGAMQAFSTNELDAMLKAASGDLDTVLSTAALAAVVFQPAELMHLTKVACGDAEDFSGFDAVSLDKFSLAVYHAIRPKIASRSCFAAPCPAAGWEPAKVAEQGFPELADYYRFYRDAINCLPKQSFIKAAMRIGPLQGLHGGDLAKIDAGVRGLVHAGMADDNLPPSP
ncbi:MAG TPA: hypothetical protein VLH09_06210 [Bryobacteraceae bacterium]|nr:hypothetical protein [Bryobacteraceae bacterium]